MITTSRQIELDGKTIDYNLSRKKVRNITIRITTDGSVNVSCPMRTPVTEVESFLRRESPFIFKSLGKVHSRIENAARPKLYQDGEQVNVFGERCVLQVNPGYGFKGVRYEYPDIYINAQNTEQTKKLYENWRRRMLRDKIAQMLEYYIPMFEAKGADAPGEIRFRTMSTRWGVCVPSTGKITFNYNLFEVPEELIAYVVVHELAHLLEANHSPRFWAHVEDVMPDYKVRRKTLREY